MEIIELGGRRAQEVYMELKQRLDGMGLLPDESFSLSNVWQPKKIIPQDAVAVCSVDYGNNEGVFLDIQLGWQDGGRFKTVPFVVGRTLYGSGAALDRMYQTAAAVTKAFRGDRGQYSNQTRKSSVDHEETSVALSYKEKDIILSALLDRREMLVGELDGTEQLLRRLVGSITEYIDLAGARPLRITDYDKAVLAIHDGEVEAFRNLYPRLPDRADELLIEAAGRAGRAGRKMTDWLLIDVKEFSKDAYLDASKKAVDTGDLDRTKYLMENMMDRVQNPDQTYYGQVILHTWRQDREMVKELVDWCPDIWIKAASPDLLYYLSALPATDHSIAETLVKKGASSGDRAWEILNRYIASGAALNAAILIRDGLKVAPDDYGAFDVCVKGGAFECAKLLIQGGFDFEGYLEWEPSHSLDRADEEIINKLTQIWKDAHQREQTGDAAPQLGGMML